MKLVELCTPKQWRTVSFEKFTESGYPVYGANGKVGFYSEFTHEEPTVMITCRGATCGTINVSEPRSYINGNAMALDNLSPEIDQRFLYYFLSSYDFNGVISGSAQPQITIQGLQKVVVPVPPISVQRQIAYTLNKADALRQKDQQLLQKYDELAQSIFYEMFGDPVRNERGWEMEQLSTVCSKVTDGTHDTPQRLTEGIKFITGKHIRPGVIDFDNSDYVTEEVHKEIYRRCNPEYGDVLYTNIGVNFGTAAFNPVSYEFSMKNVALLKPDSRVLHGTYLESLLNFSTYKSKVVVLGGVGGAQQFLSLKQIRGLEIPVPPKVLQSQYSGILATLRKSVSKVTITDSTALFNNLLSHFFTS